MSERELSMSVNARLENEALNALFSAAWADHAWRDFAPVLERGLVHVSAYAGEQLVGFANVATDGGAHAFLLDPTVHPSVQRSGIGTALVRRAVVEAKARGATWLHVDFLPELEAFYRGLGFRHTHAGLIDLRRAKDA